MMCRRKNTISRLKHRLTLQQEIRTPDDVGGYVRSWKDIADLWAEIMPVMGNERIVGNKIQSEITHKILLRYRDGISSDMRLIFEKRAFNIRSVINVSEDRDVIELLVIEGMAG